MVCLPAVGKGCGLRSHGRHRILAGALCGQSPQRQAASPALAPQSPPAHRAALPTAARLRCFALVLPAAAAPCWQRWATRPQQPAPCHRFLLAAVAACQSTRQRCASGAVKVASHPEGSRRRRMEAWSSGTFSIADEACWQAQASSFYHYST